MLRVSFVVASLLFASVATAQPAAVQQHTEHVAEGGPENPELTRATVSLGGTWATGNTRNFSLVGSGSLELRRDANVFLAEVKGQYGEASVRDPMTGDFGAFQTNAENVSGRLRYDRFFTANDAVFGAVVARRDRFAGLDLRLQLQVGYLREFFDTDEGKHRFWGEIGYDFTYDNFDPDPLLDPMTMMVLDGSAAVHSARAFVGYTNRLNDVLTYETGVEVLVNVTEPSDTRLNWHNALRCTLARGLQVSLDFDLHYDHEPVPGTESLDTLTTLNVVLTIESPDPDAAAS